MQIAVIAVIICSIIVVFMTVINVVVCWQIDGLLKEHLKSLKENIEELENDK